MGKNQIIQFVSLSVIILYVLDISFFNFFRKNKDFKVAKMEELPEGDYTVFEIIPRTTESGRGFQLQEILLIKLCERDRKKGHLMAVFFTTELIEFSKDKGNILGFSIFHKKHSCFIKVNFGNAKEGITLKKTLGTFPFGERWVVSSKVFN